MGYSYGLDYDLKEDRGLLSKEEHEQIVNDALGQYMSNHDEFESIWTVVEWLRGNKIADDLEREYGEAPSVWQPFEDYPMEWLYDNICCFVWARKSELIEGREQRVKDFMATHDLGTGYEMLMPIELLLRSDIPLEEIMKRI